MTTEKRPTRFRIFNPHRLTADEIRNTFVARQKLFDSILRDITAHSANGVPQHHLVVGQRGMGKTTLLQRIAVELFDEPHRQHFLPMTFPEEQYIEVDRLSKFWLNCLDSAADALERENNTAAVEAIDKTVRQLEQHAGDETTFAEECFAAFRKLWKDLKRRPVLLVDNFNLLLSRIRDHDYTLRGQFTKRGAPILVAASTVYPDQTEDYGAAFYEGFKPHVLNPLSLDEMQEIFAHLAQVIERPALESRIKQETPRLAALRDLTGGNPRTAVLLFELFVDGFSEDAYEDLDGLLDIVTPLYQSRLEQLSEQAQTIVGALARNWAPMTRADIVESARLTNSSVPAQLGRLRDVGLVEETAVFPSKKTGYQIAERFFNIWYLMRFTTRRQRSSLSSLARFLEEYHTPAERLRSARALMARTSMSRGNINYALALAQSLGDLPEALELERQAELALIEQMQGVRSAIAEVLDPEEIAPQVYEFADLKRQLAAAVPADAELQRGEFVDLVLRSPSMISGGVIDELKIDRTAIAGSTLSAAAVDQIAEQLRQERKLLVDQFDQESVDWLGERLCNNVLSSWDNVEQLAQLVQAATGKPQLLALQYCAGKPALGKLPEKEFASLATRLESQPARVASPKEWVTWGRELHNQYRRYTCAEAAYREAIRINPKDHWAWNNLGILLDDHLDRHEEAEAAYREAIRIDPELAPPWNNLGVLLVRHLDRPEEAESAYREAIRIDPELAPPWNNLGILLARHLNRPEEAEAAYREAIRIDPEFAWPWNGLGILLVDHLNRPEEAEAAYREAIRIDPEFAWPWNGLGNLYFDYSMTLDEAVNCFETALRIDPDCDVARHNLAFLYRDTQGNPDNARDQLNQVRDHSTLLDTQHLHEALFAAYDENWGLAADELRAALSEIDGRLPPNTRDDWFRTSAVLLHLDYGEKLVGLLKEEGSDVTLMPWFAAVEAHAVGDRRHLVNFPVEARPAAEKIFDEIDRRRSQLPDSTRRTGKA